MGTVTTRAAALGFATTDDPSLPVDPAAVRMLPADATGLGVALAGGVLEVLTGAVPTGAEMSAFETVSGCAVTITVAEPGVYAQIRARATQSGTGDARDLPSLLSDVPAAATTVHLRSGAVPTVRVDGTVQALSGWPALSGADVLTAARFATGANSGTDRVGVVFPWAGSRWRTASFVSAGAANLVLRRIPLTTPRLDQLGLPAAVADAADLRSGLVVLAGATSSGRSTTFSALIERIHTSRRSWITTLEAPVLRPVAPGQGVVTQRDIGPDTTDVATGVRTAVECGCDVIAISAPLQTADDLDAVLTAAGSGALVLLAVRADDAQGALTHLLGLVPSEYRAQAADRLGAVLRAAVAQQLLTSRAGTALPAVEVLWANPALTSVVRTDRLGELATAASADPSGRSVTMRSAVEALVSAGRLAPSEEAAWRAAHPALGTAVAASGSADLLEDEDALDAATTATASTVGVGGLVQPGEAGTRRGRRRR